MAHLQRLIWFAVGFVLITVPMLAWSATPGYRLVGPLSYGNNVLACRTEIGAHLMGLVGYSGATTAELAGRLDAASPATFSCANGQTATKAAAVSITSGSNVRWSYSINTYQQDIRIGYEGYTQECVTGEIDPATGMCVECPPGEDWNGTACASCPAGQVKNPYTLLCQEECPKPPASVGRLHTSSGNPICSFGCLQTRGAAPGGSTCVLSLDMSESGDSSLICDYGYTGAFCGWIGEMAGGDNPPIPEAPGEDEPPPPPPETEPTPPQPESCPAGFESASVNGVSVCVNSGPPVKNQNTTTTNTTTNNTTNNTTTNTTTTTTTNNVYNQQSNTTTTTTTTTVNETTINNTTGEVVGGGTVTTVVQETTPGNGVPEATEGNGNGSGECDPATGECGGGSIWSAACGGEVRCEGDAIQCAIARLAHEQSCAQKAIREEAETFMEALGAEEPSQAKLAEALNTDGEFDFDIAEAFQDAQQNYVTFASSCLPPMGFTFKGQTYTFNTGFICEIGDFVRLMLHLVAYMAVLRIVARAFG